MAASDGFHLVKATTMIVPAALLFILRLKNCEAAPTGDGGTNVTHSSTSDGRSTIPVTVLYQALTKSVDNDSIVIDSPETVSKQTLTISRDLFPSADISIPEVHSDNNLVSTEDLHISRSSPVVQIPKQPSSDDILPTNSTGTPESSEKSSQNEPPTSNLGEQIQEVKKITVEHQTLRRHYPLIYKTDVTSDSARFTSYSQSSVILEYFVTPELPQLHRSTHAAKQVPYPVTYQSRVDSFYTSNPISASTIKEQENSQENQVSDFSTLSYDDAITKNNDTDTDINDLHSSDFTAVPFVYDRTISGTTTVKGPNIEKSTTDNQANNVTVTKSPSTLEIIIEGSLSSIPEKQSLFTKSSKPHVVKSGIINGERIKPFTSSSDKNTPKYEPLDADSIFTSNISENHSLKSEDIQSELKIDEGTSLVPLVGNSKEILTLKDDGHAILAILQAVQGSESLEDPFKVTSIMQSQGKVTAQDESLKITTTNFPSTTAITEFTDEKSFEDNNEVDSIQEPMDIGNNEHKDILDKVYNEDYPLSIENEIEINTSLPKPIYEEISDTLKVDSSIDDVEDFDRSQKRTESNDDLILKANQSHINLIDTDLHQEHSVEIQSSTSLSSTFTVTAPSEPTSIVSLEPFAHQLATKEPNNTETDTSQNMTQIVFGYPSQFSRPRDIKQDPAKINEDTSRVRSTLLTNSSTTENKSSVFHHNSESDSQDHYNMVLQERGKLMQELMDPTADPCVDFYQYACGGWDTRFPIRQDKAVDNTFERLKEDLDDVLRSLLEEPTRDTDNNITKQIKILYAGCMNKDRIEALGAEPLLTLLEDLGGWPVLHGDEWSDADYDWVTHMAQLRNYNNDILISEWVAADITNSSNHIIQLDQPELGLPGREYFINPGDYLYREAYLNLMLNVTHLLGASEHTAKKDMTEVLNFEKSLSRILTSAEERRNLSAVHRRMTLEDLKEEIPEVDWESYLEAITWHNNNTEELVVFGLEYFKKLVPLINETPNRTISNYLIWRFVKNRISNLGEKYIQVKQDYIKVLFGRKTQPERWRSCVTYVSGNLGYVVGSMFVRRYFPEASKNDTDEMIARIRDSFKEALSQAHWMDAETRDVAQDKVDTIVKNVGYPEYLLNDTYMDAIYSELSFTADHHFENVMKMLQFHARTNHNLLGNPVNRTAWVTSPAVVNAYYSRSKNMIVFPAGILQPPFYHPAFPRSLNYGGIGVVIGHEITHGFDDRGRQFDKNGNLQQWWKPHDVSQFYQRASCMLDQYGEYKVEDVGLKINPVNTLGENIADNAGIKIAYQAYQDWRKENRETATVSHLDLSHEQLFFLNFGQIWCEVNSPEAMLTKIRSGQHSPNRFRVIGTLSNSVEFSEAFQCPVGSPMNPERKCQVW